VTFRCVELAEVDSTNSYLARESALQPSLTGVFSWNQTSGRGRLGRTWVGIPGDTLAFSLSFPLLAESHSSSWLPLLTGHVLCGVLRNAGILAASVKWPNDVMVGGEKVAGILVEALAHAYVVGVGVNVSSSPVGISGHGATSLLQHGWAPNDVVAEIIEPVFWGVHQALALTGAPEAVMTQWKESVVATLDTMGRFVEVGGQEGEPLRGIASDLAPDGALVLSIPGETKTVTIRSGDIFHIAPS
jgi:BirA family biotin operon repressor/biotin-[acetyl-CoA-carboxylase] ligase